MRHLFVYAVVLSLSLPTYAKLPKKWEDIANNPKYKKTPTAETFRKQMVPQASGWRLYDVSDRFGFLFDPSGQPYATFDYTMDQLTLKDLLLGGIGIGRWSLRGMWKKYKQVKENPMDVMASEDSLEVGQMPTPNSQDEVLFQDFYKEMNEHEQKTLPLSNEKEIERGYKEFAKLKFKDSWIRAHQNLRIAGKDPSKKDGFMPGSFTMADLYIEQKHEGKVYEAMRKFSEVILKQNLSVAELDHFMTQFQMNWDNDKKQFDMVWSARSFLGAKADKQPLLPAPVVVYVEPLAILAYKYSLSNLERNASLFETIFGRYGSILSVFVSRVVNNAKNQMNSHENQLQALLEAYMRGEYVLDIPLEDPNYFVDQTITLLYLNKMLNTDDITDGEAKRQQSMEKEAEYREEVMGWLSKKGFEVKPWSDNRLATVYKDGRRKGIVNLVMKRQTITRQPSFIHYDKVSWFKSANRLLLEVFVDAVRLAMPDSFALSNWISKWINIGFSIYIPTMFWDMLFKSRMYTEIAYEGMAIARVNESLAGRWSGVEGYSMGELTKLRSTFANQRQNPFEAPVKYEASMIKTNKKILLDAIGGAREVNSLISRVSTQAAQ